MDIHEKCMHRWSWSYGSLMPPFPPQGQSCPQSQESLGHKSRLFSAQGSIRGSSPKGHAIFPKYLPCVYHNVQCFTSICGTLPHSCWKNSRKTRQWDKVEGPRSSFQQVSNFTENSVLISKPLKLQLRIIMPLVEYLLYNSNYNKPYLLLSQY